MFQLNLMREVLINFEDCAECVIYKKLNEESYYYQFLKIGTDEVDKLNPKLMGPFNSLSETKHVASEYYRTEWMPF